MVFLFVTRLVLGEARLSAVSFFCVVANLFAYEYSMGRRFPLKSSTNPLRRFKALSIYWRVSFLHGKIIIDKIPDYFRCSIELEIQYLHH